MVIDEVKTRKTPMLAFVGISLVPFDENNDIAAHERANGIGSDVKEIVAPVSKFEIDVENEIDDGILSRNKWCTWIQFCKVMEATDGLEVHGNVIDLIKQIDAMHAVDRISQVVISGISYTRDAVLDDF